MEVCTVTCIVLKYHSTGHMVKGIQRFGTSCILDSRPYKKHNLQIKLAYKKTLTGDEHK